MDDVKYGGPGASGAAAPASGGTMKILGIGILAIVLLVGGFFGCAFVQRNAIIDGDQQANARYGDIEATLQRRLDLVPNLIATVQGATKYEGETMAKIVEKRNIVQSLAAQMKETIKDPAQAERTDKLNNDLLGAIRAYTGVASEAYPQLRATDAFANLMSQLEGTENRIAVARRDYNAAVAHYNGLVQKWGFLPFCGGRQPRYVFQAAPDAQQVPNVKF